MKLVVAIRFAPFAAWTEHTGNSPHKVIVQALNDSTADQTLRRALSPTADRTLVEIHHALATAYAKAGRYTEAQYQFGRAMALAERAHRRA